MAGNTNTIKEFLVGLGFKVDENGMNTFLGKIETASKNVAEFAAGVEAAAAGIFIATTHIAEGLKTIFDESERIKVPVEEIEEFSYTAEQLGGSAEGAKESLEGVAKAAGLAAIGLGRGRKVFAQLHIQVKDANGRLKNSSVLLTEIGQKIKGLEGGQQLAILSRLGIDQRLLKTLTSDTHDLREEFEQLEKAAGFDSNKAAANASLYVNALNKIKTVFEVLEKAIGAQFFERFTRMMDSFRHIIVDNMPEIVNAIVPVIKVILDLGEVIFQLGAVVARDIKIVVGWLGELNRETSGISNAVIAFVVAWRYLNLAFIATPIGLIITGLAGILLLLDDIKGFNDGKNSLFNYTAIMPALNALYSILKIIGNAFLFVVDILTGNFTGAIEATGNVVQSFFDIFKNGWDQVKGVGQWIAHVAEVAADGISNFGGGNRVGSFAGPVPPPPTFGASLGGANINQDTTIIIQGGSDPKSTALEVAGHQGRVNGDMVRNLKGNVQ